MSTLAAAALIWFGISYALMVGYVFSYIVIDWSKNVKGWRSWARVAVVATFAASLWPLTLTLTIAALGMAGVVRAEEGE